MNDLDRLPLRLNPMFTICIPHGRVLTHMRRRLSRWLKSRGAETPGRKAGSGKGPAILCVVSRSFSYITL